MNISYLNFSTVKLPAREIVTSGNDSMSHWYFSRSLISEEKQTNNDGRILLIVRWQ